MERFGDAMHEHLPESVKHVRSMMDSMRSPSPPDWVPAFKRLYTEHAINVLPHANDVTPFPGHNFKEHHDKNEEEIFSHELSAIEGRGTIVDTYKAGEKLQQAIPRR